MSRVCPVDYKSCPDDMCHGAGCVRSSGEEMIDLCDFCGQELEFNSPCVNWCGCQIAESRDNNGDTWKDEGLWQEAPEE